MSLKLYFLETFFMKKTECSLLNSFYLFLINIDLFS